MAYRELHRMEIEEVVRRWQVNESQRAIARATGLARETVKKYLAAAGDLGLSATGPPPTERELVELRRLGVVATLIACVLIMLPAAARERYSRGGTGTTQREEV